MMLYTMLDANVKFHRGLKPWAERQTRAHGLARRQITGINGRKNNPQRLALGVEGLTYGFGPVIRTYGFSIFKPRVNYFLADVIVCFLKLD